MLNRAMLLFRMKQYTAATRDLESILTIATSPKDRGRIQYNLALVQLAENNTPGAKALLLQAIENHNDDAKALLSRLGSE